MPEIDRNGEMPEGASTGKNGETSVKKEKKQDGLAGDDLLTSATPTRTPSAGRFKEYDEDVTVREDVPVQAVQAEQQEEQAVKEKGVDADNAAVSGDIQVIKVKRKKKKRTGE